MAEAVGVASGVVGVAVFAMQVGEGILKLKRLWSSVRNAPQEISILMDQVGVAANLLQEIEATHPQDFNSGSSPGQALCVRLYKQALDRLSSATEKLEHGLATSKRGALKAAMSKDKLKELKEALEYATNMLILAQQSYTFLRINNIHAAVTTFQNLTPSQPALTEESTLTVAHLPLSSSAVATTSVEDWTATDKSNQFNRHRHRRLQAKSRAALQYRFCASWLQTAWKIQMGRASAGWEFSFCTYALYTYRSPAARCVVEGDIAGLHRLFQDNKATPFDREVGSGKTLLHLAVTRYQADIAHFLLSHGADINARDWKGENTVLGAFLNCYDFLLSDIECCNRRKKTLILLITNNECDDLIGEDAPELLHRRGWYGDDASELLLFRQQIFPPYLEAPITTRVANISRPISSKLFWITLGQMHLDQSCFSVIRGETLFHTIASQMGPINNCESNEAKSRKDILRQSVIAAGHLSWPRSSLSPAIRYITSDPECPRLEHLHAHFNARLQQWARELAGAGADLMAYGKLEDTLFQRRDQCDFWHFFRVFKLVYIDIKFRVVGFTYGPEPEDWKLWVSWPLDEWTAEFWHLVENPELFGPGSWVEETSEELVGFLHIWRIDENTGKEILDIFRYGNPTYHEPIIFE